MFITAFIFSTLMFAGLGLFLHLECRDKDALIIRRNGQVKRLTVDVHNLQRQLQTETNNKHRLLIRNQQLTAQVTDQKGMERRLVFQLDALLTQHEQLQIDHAKHVLGGTLLPDDGRGQE